MTLNQIVAEVTLAANTPISGNPENIRAWFAFGLIAIAIILAAIFIDLFCEAAAYWQTIKEKHRDRSK